MADASASGRVPILCGGTGLYFAALTEGLSDIPAIPGAAREEARRLLAELGPAALHARLAAIDPETAATLRPTDSQRIARAHEVAVGTGRGLRAWQREGGTGPRRGASPRSCSTRRGRSCGAPSRRAGPA
jgi:tRNA dimethylallyltransferase